MIVQTLVRSTVIAVGMCGFLGIPLGPEQAQATEAGQTIAQSADYFPDTVGTRWQYRGQISEGPLQTIENKYFFNVSSVTGTRTLKGGVVVNVFHDTNPGNHGASDSFYRRDAAGVVYYGSEPGTPLEKQLVPYQIIRFPMKVAQSFQQFNRTDIDFLSQALENYPLDQMCFSAVLASRCLSPGLPRWLRGSSRLREKWKSLRTVCCLQISSPTN